MCACPQEFASCWHPQMIFVGAVAFNLLEVFWVVDPDMRKNANLECTLFARLLHMVSTELPRPLPRHWSMQVDNATAEGKNQTVAKFMAWLTWKKLFDSTELTEFSVGHTHNVQDQRFAECATAIKSNTSIQVPSDVVKVITDRVKARQNRKLVCERVFGAFDWHEFFDELGVSMHGHTQTRAMKTRSLEACHVWRFFRREDVQWEGVIFSDWPALEPHPADIILLVKQCLDDEQYSQEPLVFCPNACWEKLAGKCPDVDVRTKLSDRQTKEFTKTSIAVAAKPWVMTKA